MEQNKTQGIDMAKIIHIAIEIFIAAGITYWMHKRSSSLEKKTEELEKKIEELSLLLEKHANILTNHGQNIMQIANIVNGDPPRQVNSQPKRHSYKKKPGKKPEPENVHSKPVITEETEDENIDEVLQEEIRHLEKIEDEEIDSETEMIGEKKTLSSHH